MYTTPIMKEHRIYTMAFSKVYPLYIQKAEKKGRTKIEVDTVIQWLTGYERSALTSQVKKNVSIREFFDQAPTMNPKRKNITGVVCGVRVENVPEPLMREIRYLDKLVDELAKGKSIDKIFDR